MIRIILARPGSTEYDEQGRIQGTLSIPLSEQGSHQVANAVLEMEKSNIEMVYSSPCLSAQETAAALAEAVRSKVKPINKLQNLNHRQPKHQTSQSGKLSKMITSKPSNSTWLLVRMWMRRLSRD